MTPTNAMDDPAVGTVTSAEEKMRAEHLAQGWLVDFDDFILSTASSTYTFELNPRREKKPMICPRCGAPYDGDKCDYCGTRFR